MPLKLPKANHMHESKNTAYMADTRASEGEVPRKRQEKRSEVINKDRECAKVDRRRAWYLRESISKDT